MCCFMSPCSNNGNGNDECSAAGDGDDDGTTYMHNPLHFSNRENHWQRKTIKYEQGGGK